MSKFTNDARRRPRTSPVTTQAVGVTHDPKFVSTVVKSYEGGTNYTLDPIATLRMILASSIFGEPSFYESGNYRTEKTVKAIDDALSYDFDATLRLAAELREKAWMRLNPQVIYTRAAMHPSRVAYTEANPGMFNSVMSRIALRPDDITTQVEYFLSANKGKNRMPGILKRAAAKRLGEFGAYHIRKYANRGIGLVDVVRITHATSEPISALIKGELKVDDSELTWKELKSAGKSWTEILNSGITLSHSDLLYNLRGILSDVSEADAKAVVEKFVKGVERGNIWPYKYYTAYKTLDNGPDFANKAIALRGISRALESRINAGKINRKAAVLSDGSASMTWGSEVSGMQAAEIAAVSSAITAKQYDSAVLVPFATDVKIVRVDNTRNVFDLVRDADAQKWNLGGGTDMARAINLLTDSGIYVDDIYIYSDMQTMAGTDKAIATYRKKVNPRVNVISIQVAGYDNSVLPENNYRFINMSGWVGKEVDYVLEIDAIWNDVEGKR